MLIIVESPAKARTIKNILGSGYQVEASIGHIRALSDSKKTKDGRKLVVNGIDIDNGFEPMYEIAEGKQDVVKKLKQLAKAANGEILFATDSDREGESISWHLAELLGIKDKSKIKRLEFHEITASAIKEALAHPRPLNTDLVEAQKARQVLDKLVGYRLSPVLWAVLSDYKLSAGRVQSPALVLVYKRELEIEAFQSEEYWEGLGDFAASPTKLTTKRFVPDDVQEKLPFTLKELPSKYDQISGVTVAGIESDLNRDNKFRVSSVTTKTATSRPRPPFTTSTLQQAASSRLGMAPRATMQAAQRLYEGVDLGGRPTALITYMRTDSTFLSQEAISKIRGELTKHHPEHLHDTSRVYSSKSKNAQEAHESIRPTDPSITPQSIRGQIEPRLWKLYNLIWSRAMATQSRDEVRELTNYVLTNADGFVFTYTHSEQKVLGWKYFEGVGKNDEITPSVTLKEGSEYYLNLLNLFQKFTQPPGRFSPASLIKELEKEGIGRPSTYASIISTLYDRGYVEEDQKSLISSALGRSVAKILLDNFTEITGKEMTAEMEDNLDKISRHELDYKTLLTQFWGPFDQEVASKTELLKADREKYKRLSSETIPDPTGKGMLVLRLGRFGEYWQNEEDPKLMYPKFFREIETTLKANNELYGAKVKTLFSPVSKEPLTIRVSKKSLNPYVATESYTVGSQEKALNIDKLNELGWTQKTVDQLYVQKPTTGKGGFRRRFSGKRSKKK
jgi:DNA topoisomerase I